MNYSEFVKTMQLEVKEKMDEGIRVERHTVLKNNGTLREGLVISTRDSNVSPTIYLEEFYDQYLNGTPLMEVVQSIMSLYDQIKVSKPYHYDEVISYDKMKNRILYKLVNKELNQDLLKDIPYIEYLDLAIVFYILVETTSYGNASILIRNEHLMNWGVSLDEIYESACKNTRNLLPLEVEKMTQYMYLVTNKLRNLGASTILYPETCKELEEMIQDNFYILPSSIHEVIIIPESYGVDKEHLEFMVREINETEVDAEDLLSDHVYFYDKTKKEIMM